jgi:hypothetical protein
VKRQRSKSSNSIKEFKRVFVGSHMAIHKEEEAKIVKQVAKQQQDAEKPGHLVR